MKNSNSADKLDRPQDSGELEASDSESRTKKPYRAPKLESWGSLADLTKNAPVGGGDALGGGSTT